MVVDAMFCMKCGAKRGATDDAATTIAKAAKAPASGEDADSNINREELVNQISDMVKKLQAGPKPGLTHNAKKWKDKLREDPYNLDVMHALGLAYAQDEHWEKCANVMIRGLKRTEEFKDVEKSYDYLYTLCQASLRVKKFQQAMMVMKELKVPAEGTFIEFEVLQCQVYCANGDSQKGIKAFHQAIKGSGFADASAVWAMCHTYLKKVEAYDICKQAIEALAQKEEDPEVAQKKLVVLEGIAELRESAKAEATGGPGWVKVAKYCGGIYVIFLMFVLYYLEGKSLASLKIGK